MRRVRGGRASGTPKLIPTPKTCERLLLDFREERRELSPLCPEVCGACPREGVTSRAPAGPSPGARGTRSRPCWHPGGFGASPAREDDQISACGRPVRSLTLTTKSDPSGLPHSSHTARWKRRGAESRGWLGGSMAPYSRLACSAGHETFKENGGVDA